MTARVAEIWRYPVKSMLGESLSGCAIGPAGVVGDRAYALIDGEDGNASGRPSSSSPTHSTSCLALCLALRAGADADEQEGRD